MRLGERALGNTSRTRSLVRGPLRLFPGTWSICNRAWMLLRGQGATVAFANAQTSPSLELNINYGIYPLSDGAA